VEIAHNIVFGTKTALPKTIETMGLLERALISLAELPELRGERSKEETRVTHEVQETLRGRLVA